MAGVITWAQGTDIGGGRGRLAEDPAKSLARIDADLGWLLGINEAWRDPAVADRLYADYISGRSSVIALPGKDSVHCRGYAIDTPNSDLAVLLARHGWFQTVYRNGVLVEPWHFEYDPNRDTYRTIPMTKGADGVWRKDDDMPLNDADKNWLNGLGSAIIGQVRDAVGDKAWLNGLGSSIIDQTTERVARDLPGLVWAEPVQAQDSDGLLLTHPDGSPVTVPASGYPASTNAQIHALREAVRLLALGQGADPAAIEEAAMNGARRALERLTLIAKA